VAFPGISNVYGERVDYFVFRLDDSRRAFFFHFFIFLVGFNSTKRLSLFSSFGFFGLVFLLLLTNFSLQLSF
jgi:hypothetical protein